MTSPRPAPSVPASARVDALDGLRGVAVLSVVVMHAALLGLAMSSMGGEAEAGLLRGYLSVALLGWCGVDLFFVLSGFLITGILVRSVGRPHYFRNFYARRALRIFPLYYAVLVLLLFVLERGVTSPAERLSYFLYYQNLYFATWGHLQQDPARTITWSLAVEEQFYLLWPAVVAWLAPRRLVAFCFVTIGGAIGVRLLLVHSGCKDAYFLTPCRLDALAAGALLALSPRPPAWCGTVGLLVGATGLYALAIAGGSSLPDSPLMQGFGLLAALLFAVGGLVSALGQGWLARCCRWRWLRSLGCYSYCIYLTHWLVLEGLSRALHEPAGDLRWRWPLAYTMGFTVVSVALCWLLGFCSWHAFEKWFLAGKRWFPSPGSGDER